MELFSHFEIGWQKKIFTQVQIGMLKSEFLLILLVNYPQISYKMVLMTSGPLVTDIWARSTIWIQYSSVSMPKFCDKGPEIYYPHLYFGGSSG